MVPVKLTNFTKIVLYIFIFVLGSIFSLNPYIIIIFLSFSEISIQLNKRVFFTSYLFWNFGFILLICTINIFSIDLIIEKLGEDTYYRTSRVFFTSFLFITYFYRFYSKNTIIKFEKEQHLQKMRLFFICFILFSYVTYMIYNGSRAIEIFSKGRGYFIVNSSFGGQGDQGADRGLFSTLIYYFTEITGYLIPALIFLFIKTKTKLKYALIFALILSIPFWTTQFILGTRHHILFSVLSLLGCIIILYPKIIRVKLNLFFLLIVLALAFSTSMMHVRKVGYENFFNFEEFKFEPEKTSADPSGLYMNYVVDYFNKQPYKYGQSISGLVFIWVPRSLWSNKPKGFNHWFYREHVSPGYKGFNSITCSYLAIPYSDFGIWGVIIVSILIAYFFSKTDAYLLKDKAIYTYKGVLIISFLFTISFYLPRGLTATYLKIILVLSLIYMISILNRFVIRKLKK